MPLRKSLDITDMVTIADALTDMERQRANLEEPDRIADDVEEARRTLTSRLKYWSILS